MDLVRYLFEVFLTKKSKLSNRLIPTLQSPPPEKGFDPATYILGINY